MDRETLLQAIDVLAKVERLKEPEMADILMARGFAIDQAYRLIAFVPSAFSRPVIEGVARVSFAPTADARTERGEHVTLRFEDQPEFNIALKIARHHVVSGGLANDMFAAIVAGSAETDTVNRALHAGSPLDGAMIAIGFMNPLVATYAVRDCRR